MKHTHHIIPRHMGGTDDPGNLIDLTIEEHAEAHRLLYEQHGRWQDKVAWQGLLGLISHEEVMEEMYAARRGENNTMYGKPCYYKMTEEEKQQWKDNIRKSRQGIKDSEETKKRKSIANMGKHKGREPWNKGKTGVQIKSLESKKKVSVPVIFRGVEYYSIKEAARQNNLSDFLVKKEIYGSGTTKARDVNNVTTSK